MKSALLLSVALLGCGSSPSELDGANLPDAAPISDAELPDAPPAAPETARVRLNVRGVALAGVPVVFHDAAGVPVTVTVTGNDGVAEAVVGPGAMATVLDLRDAIPRLTTFVGVEPGDDLLVAAPELAVDPLKATISFATVPGVTEYLVSAGCASQSVSYAGAMPAQDKASFAIPGTCLVDGGAHFHVLAKGTGTTGLVAMRAMPAAEFVVDLSGHPWLTSPTAQEVQIASLDPKVAFEVRAELVPADGAPAEYDLVSAQVDEAGERTVQIRPGLGDEPQRLTINALAPTPATAIVVPGIRRLITVESTAPTPPATTRADFAEVKGTLYTVSLDGQTLSFTGTGELAQMTGMRTTLAVRRADDVVYRWSFVHPPGAPLVIPQLPDSFAAQRPATFIPASIVLERGTPYVNYGNYRKVQGRMPSTSLVYRSSIVVTNPTPPPL